MTTFSRTLIVAALVMTPATFAHAQAGGPATKSTAKSMAPKAPAAKPATSLVAIGTVAKFDAASSTLTITTPKGDVMFAVNEKTSLKEGSKTIQPSALTGLTGHQARVQYAEKDGTKTVASVHVTGGKPKGGK